MSLNTSLARSLPTEHFFEDPRRRDFLDEALSAPGDRGPRWRIPFFHHPAYCAGSSHANTAAMVEHLVPLFERAGVRAAFAGHEHNFQAARQGSTTYFVSGAGGQLREEMPEGFDAAGTFAWAAQAHLLLARVDGRTVTVTPVAALGSDGAPEAVTPRAPDGSLVEVPFVISLSGS